MNNVLQLYPHRILKYEQIPQCILEINESYYSLKQETQSGFSAVMILTEQEKHL